MNEPTTISNINDLECKISRVKSYFEARLNLESGYVESLKNYFDTHLILLFNQVSNLEDDNTTLRKEIEILKEENLTKFRNLSKEIESLSKKFEDLKL